MEKIIKIAPSADKEDKLQGIMNYIGEVKDTFFEVVEEYESDGADTGKINTLTEVLGALEDAFEAVSDVVMDGM